MASVPDDLARVVPLYTLGSPRHQVARRRAVRAALVDAHGWIVAGLEGACTLEEAVTEASLALSPALREICRAALS